MQDALAGLNNAGIRHVKNGNQEIHKVDNRSIKQSNESLRRLNVRLDEKLFVKKFEDERLKDDCISALACVDFCAMCSALLITRLQKRL